MKKIILILAVFMLLFSCSIVEDMSDTAQVNIQLGDIGQGSSRFIAEESDNIIIAFLSESDVYLYEEFDVKTTISMNGIITGDYILLVLLREANDDNVVGLASQDVTIEAGVNYIDVTLGPGLWGLKLNPDTAKEVELDLSDLPNGYDMLVGADKIAFDIPDDQFIDGGGEIPDFTIEFKTNAQAVFVTTSSGSLSQYSDFPNDGDTTTVSFGALDGARSFYLEMEDPVDGISYYYTISFNESDDMMIIEEILE